MAKFLLWGVGGALAIVQSSAGLGAQVEQARSAEGVRVTGVVREAHGLGVPAARVQLRVDGETTVRTFADGDGVFVLRGGPADRRFDIVAEAPGLISEPVAVVASAGSLVHVQPRLVEALPLTVSVQDELGAPVPGAWVSASRDVVPDLAGHALQELQTDANGVALFAALPFGTIDVRVFRSGSAVGSRRVRLDAARRLSVRLLRPGGTSVNVRINGFAKGADVRLEVQPLDGGRPQAMPTPVAKPRLESGSWSAVGLPDMRTRVRVVARGYTTRPRELIYEAGRARHDLTFRLVKARPVAAEPLLSGILVDATGQPVRGRRIDLLRLGGPGLPPNVWIAHTYTDASGRFVLTGVAHRNSATYRVGCRGAFKPWPVPVAESGSAARGVRLQLPVPGTVRGAVVATNKRPLSGARVRLRGVGREAMVWPLPPVEVRAGRDGRFVFLAVPPGRYRLELLGDRSEPKSQTAEFEIRPGAKVRQDLREWR